MNFRFSLLFILISILFFYFQLNIVNYFLRLLIIWVSCNYFFLAIIYFLNDSKLLMKKKNGKNSFIIHILMFPYFFINYIIWYLHYKISSEEKINHFVENFYIGKKVFFEDLPESIDTVIDLTSEFSEDLKIIQNKKYISFPILDGSVPDKNKLIQFLNEIKHLNSKTLIHCAEGHGRTFFVAILIYLLKNKNSNFEDSIKFINSKRKKMKLNSFQEKFLIHFIKTEFNTLY